jgi:hypothetical protein
MHESSCSTVFKLCPSFVATLTLVKFNPFASVYDPEDGAKEDYLDRELELAKGDLLATV